MTHDLLHQSAKDSIDFRAVFEAMPGNSVLVKVDPPRYTILEVTHEYLQVSGKKKQDLTGKGIFESFPPNPQDPDFTGQKNLSISFEKVRDAKKPNQVPVQRYDVINGDGSFAERYWTAINKPVFDSDGKVIYIIHTAIEITDDIKMRKREEKIKGMEQAHNLFMQAPIAICILKGDDLVIELANDPALKLWGKTKVVIGKPVAEALPELSGQGYTELLNQVIHTGESYRAYESPATFVINDKKEEGYFNYIFQPYYEEDSKNATGVLVLGYDVTLQVLASKKIEESEVRFRALIGAAPIAIGLFKGSEFIIELPNQAFIELMGKDAGIVGKRFRDAMPALEGQSFLEILNEVFISGKNFQIAGTPVNILQQGIMKAGYYDFSYTPLFNGEENVYAVLAIAVDVTGQVMARKKIEESEQQVRAMVESAPFPIGVYTGKEMRIELANQSIIDAWGKGNDVIGKLYSDLLPELDNQQIIAHLNTVFATGIPFHARNERVDLVVNGQLQTYYYNYSFTPLYDASGKVYGVMNTGANVTDLNIAKQKVEISERNFRNLVMQAPVGICIVKRDPPEADLANDLFLHIVGKPRNTLTHPPYWEVFPETVPFDSGILENVFSTGVPYQGQEQEVLLFRNGREELIHVSFVYEPIKEEDGRTTRVMILVVEVTHQVLARKKIEESEFYFRQVTDNVPAMIWMTEPDGYCTYLNKHWYDYTGQSRQESEGFGWLNSTHPDDREKASQVFWEASDQQIAFSALYRLRTKSGEYRWAIDRGSPRFNSYGIYEGMIGTVVDVQEQKQTEEMLRYRKALLEAHNEASFDGILLVDTKGKILSYNHSFVDIWEMPQEIIDAKNDEAALSHAMSQLVHPEQFIEKVKYLYEHPTESSIDELEYKDGKVVLRHGYPVVGEDGAYYAWSWVFRDITEQKKAEQKLIESSLKFRNLLEALPQMTWTNLPTGEVTFYNERWYHYTGLNFEQTKEWGWKAVVDPYDLEATLKAYTEALQTGNAFVVENRYKRKDGAYRWHLNRALPVRNEKGEIILWVGTATDVHEQKTAEEHLEKLVAERTAALERSNEDLQQFAHVASHDLKEPVRKVKIFASRLQEEMKESLSEKSKLYIEKIESATDRMTSMIEGVLAYSAINTLQQLTEKIDINEIIRNIETDLEVYIQQKQATITYSGLPQVEGVPVLIHQLFYNLINNSLKFAKTTDKPLISITSKIIYKQDMAFAHIEIKDNGIGFEPQYAESIFNTFTRLNSKDKYEGTGLGLALCKKIALRHRGTITAIPGSNEGAIFTVILPLNQKDHLI